MNSLLTSVGWIRVRRLLWAIWALMWLTPRAEACDACGGLGAATGFGFMPLADQTILALQWDHSLFSDGEATPLSDVSHALTPALRWLPAERLRASVAVPFRFTSVQMLTTTPQQFGGVGDVQAGLEWNAWPGWGFENRRFPGWLRLGGLVSAPTGTYMQRADDGLMMPVSYQLGRGAWGFGASMQMAVRSGRWTLSAYGTTMHFGENELRQQSGRATSVQASLFRTFLVRRWVLMPQLGLTHEHMSSDRYYGDPVAGTAADRLSAAPGLTMAGERAVLQLQWLQPLAKSAAEDSWQHSFRAVLAWNFAHKKTA